MTNPSPLPYLLAIEDGRRLAYHRTVASDESSRAGRPGVVFLGGFKSDMTGTKATFLEEVCRARGLAFLAHMAGVNLRALKEEGKRMALSRFVYGIERVAASNWCAAVGDIRGRQRGGRYGGADR